MGDRRTGWIPEVSRKRERTKNDLANRTFTPPLPDRRWDGRRGGQEADVRGTARQPKSVEIAKILWQDFPMRELQARSFLHGAKNTGRPEDGAMLHYVSSVLGLD